MSKPYKLGILVGRFQTLHLGHEDMINTALLLCEKVAVFVGSSQESGTKTNPFSFETRKNMLTTVFRDDISVFPLPDIGVGNNPEWGEYVMENVIRCCKESPDLFISGKEERRATWLGGKTGESVAELYIPKTIDISASKIRDCILKGDFESFKKYSNEKLYPLFETLRAEILASKDNTETKSI